MDIDKLLIPTNDIKNGKYSISITRIGDNIYKIDGSDIYVETSLCLELAVMGDAVLIVQSYGTQKYGSIFFIE